MNRREILEHVSGCLTKVVDNQKANRLKLLNAYIELVYKESPDAVDVSELLNGLDRQINKNVVRKNKWLEFLESVTTAFDKYYSGMSLYEVEYLADDEIDAINIQIGSLITRLSFNDYNSFSEELSVHLSRSENSGVTFTVVKKHIIREKWETEPFIKRLIRWNDKKLPDMKSTLRAVESDADEILKESYDVDELIGEIME